MVLRTKKYRPKCMNIFGVYATIITILVSYELTLKRATDFRWLFADLIYTSRCIRRCMTDFRLLPEFRGQSTLLGVASVHASFACFSVHHSAWARSDVVFRMSYGLAYLVQVVYGGGNA